MTTRLRLIRAQRLLKVQEQMRGIAERDLAESQPTGRVLTLMAAAARGAGEDEAVVRGWLARALTVPRG